MLSAFGEPPDSGKNSPACAAGAASEGPGHARRERQQQGAAEYGLRARGPAVYGADDALRAAGRPLSDPSKRGGALLDERRARPRRSRREAAISCWIEASSSSCSLHARVQPGVELALGARRRSASGRRRGGRPARRPRRAASSSAHDAVDQAPLERLRRRDALAEHRHLGRAREADALGDEQGGAAVGDEADVHEREQEVGRLGGDHEVAGERERAADARRRRR